MTTIEYQPTSSGNVRVAVYPDGVRYCVCDDFVKFNGKDGSVVALYATRTIVRIYKGTPSGFEERVQNATQ